MNTTMHNRRRLGSAALTLAILAGAPASAVAQYDRDEPRRATMTARDGVNTYRFAKSGVLMGAGVVNDNDENIGSVTDLIIDRGSGEISQALIKSGAVLGIGGKTIAVPFSRLGWDNVNERFSLSMTQEQIDRAVEFDPAAWPNLDHTTWSERVDRWWNGDAADDGRREAPGHADDAWTAQFRDAPTNRVKGSIVDVRRERVGGDEQVIAVVETDDGDDRELLLGPSWYVMGASAAPMRGDEIQANFATISDNGARRHVVTSATIDGQRLTLRDAGGQARWSLPAESASAGNHRATGRLMLLSDLIGAEAVANSDEDAGEIQNAVIEYQSGRVAILGFDPNEAFLGLGDEIKCVPWSVASVAPDGTVRIDATDEALSNCRAMPDDVTMLQKPANLEPIYTGFGVPVQRFESHRDARRGMGDAGEHSERDARFFKNFASGDAVAFAGEVTEISSRSVAQGAAQMRVLTLSTDQGQRTIILGPDWYMERQGLDLNKGDRVSIRARKADVEGRTHYTATSISTPDRQFTFWNGNDPVWNDG